MLGFIALLEPFSLRVTVVQRCGQKSAAVSLTNHNLRVVWLLLKHPDIPFRSDSAHYGTEAREDAIH